MKFSSEFRDSNYNQAHHQENLSNQESHRLYIHTLVPSEQLSQTILSLDHYGKRTCLCENLESMHTEQMTLKRLRQSL